MRRLLFILAFASCGLRAETVLVLPFFNHSNTPNLEWIGESIAETMHDALASEGVLVLDREDRLEGYRRLSLRAGAELTRASIIKIGEALDASQVIYGDYEFTAAQDPAGASKGTLRMNARILDLRRRRQEPAFTETGALEDLASLEARLGWQALKSVSPKSAVAEDEFFAARPPVRLDALESYVRGLLVASPDQRHRFFTQAARLDEDYSQPCYQLGKIYWEKQDYRVAAGWLERVRRSDPHYLEARFFLGLCRYYMGDYAGAETAFQVVASAVPLNEVFNNWGAAQDRRNDSTAAIASYRKALEGDNADPDYHFNLGYALWRAGKFGEAAASFRAALERNPQDSEATALLGACLQNAGPRPGEPRADGRQRIKKNYEEAAYRQLQAELAK